jgi:predicted ester cyclase
MAERENKALVRRFLEESSKGNAAAIAAIDETWGANVVYHTAGGQEVRGLEEYRKFTSDMYVASPDGHFAIDDMIAEGDKVAVRFSFTGTHTGEAGGIPPTNKRLAFWAINIYRVVGGKIVEGWERSDTLGIMQEMGVVPKPKEE